MSLPSIARLNKGKRLYSYHLPQLLASGGVQGTSLFLNRVNFSDERQYFVGARVRIA